MEKVCCLNSGKKNKVKPDQFLSTEKQFISPDKTTNNRLMEQMSHSQGQSTGHSFNPDVNHLKVPASASGGSKIKSFKSPNALNFKPSNSEKKMEATPFDRVTKLHCSVACMGKWCKHENWNNCDKPYVTGLHSEIVEDLIVGSCRPNSKSIAKYNMIQ